MTRTPLALLLGSTLVAGALGAQRIWHLTQRLHDLERSAGQENRRADRLDDHLGSLRSELERVRGEVERSRAAAVDGARLEQRVAASEQHLASLGAKLVDQRRHLLSLRAAQEDFGPEALDASLRDLDRTFAERWEAVFSVANDAASAAGESLQRLASLDSRIQGERDRAAMWRELMGPVVQLAGEESVGSGVLCRPYAAEEGDDRVYVLTAWHVVRDIQGSLHNRDMPVPVSIYVDETERHEESARLIEFEPEIDIALLELVGDDYDYPCARLSTPAELERVRIFDAIYAVGCPLGNDPIPTPGEIAATQHGVDDQTYIMINAPTYVGNSGGGIFEADSRALIGIFSKVYTHGSLRPTIVTHMGLVTPMHAVYAWLGEVGYAALIPTGPAPEDVPHLASADR